jgi:hypothetical protein
MYTNTLSPHNLAWSLRRTLQLSPMQRLLREIRRQSVPLSQLDALEMFGGDGSRHTMDYHRQVRSLDVWEVDGGLSGPLRRNLPGATVTTTDSFHELQVTKNTYDLIVVDTPASLFGQHKQYCEHFDVFTPSLFRVARPFAVMIVNVIPDLLHSKNARRTPPWPEQLSRRSAFYKTNRPELIPMHEMVAVYRQIAEAAGFELQWHFSLCRTMRSQVHYLAMKVGRH